jgi:Ca2+-binding RTX toxin-like protein
LRNDVVQESTGYNQAAIQITGGSVDLGTTNNPGGNTLNINGPGELIHNSGANPVSAIGNTFKINGAALTSPFRIEDNVYHALDAAGVGLVTCVAGNVYVTNSSGSVQRGVDAVAAGGTVNVEAGNYSTYTAGAKLLTVAFQNGPILAQQSDPITGGAALVVTGTAGNDTFKFNPGGPGYSVEADVGQWPKGRFSPTGRIVAYGLAGDDDIQVAGGITLPVWLYGGDGNDRLKGGGGHNVELGGAGDDLLVGGNDRDILIGGTGADRIVGNAEDDILIAGSTAFDGNEAALCAILAEWTSGRSYAARVANLTGTGTGSDFASRLNGCYFLRVTDQLATTTVFDDGAADVLTGTSGSDWFFANLSGGGVLDKITDLSAAEFANDLTFILS